jgi:hypothetical protein
MTRRLSSACLVLAGTISGCQRDARSPDAEPVRRLEYRIDQPIGQNLNDEQTSFGRITGLALNQGGQLFVADYQAAHVVVFDDRGNFLRRIGRQGAGPGELQNPCCLAFDEQDRLWVRDGLNRRYSVYEIRDSSVTFVMQVRMAHTDVNRFAATTFEQSNLVIDVGMRAVPDGTPSTHRFTLAQDGNVERDLTIPEPPAESIAAKKFLVKRGDASLVFFLYQPYGALPLLAHGPHGEWAHAISNRYAIDWRRADGTLIRHLSDRLTEGPALSAAEQQRAEERLLRDRQRIDQDPGFGVPSHKPPLSRLYFDRIGRLWVELSVADGAPRQAHIHDREGRRVAVAEWPTAIDLSYGVVRADTVWGVATDSLDVQTVVRLVPH